MTAVAPRPVDAVLSAQPERAHVLVQRLDTLRAERDQAQAEIVPAWYGDDADRATNVEAHVRLAMLESRIAALEVELDDLARPPLHAVDMVDTGVAMVRVGDVVTIDLGDGPETFLVGPVEQAGAGADVVTPGSPLGQALLGAEVGSTVTYTPRGRRALTAKVLAIS